MQAVKDQARGRWQGILSTLGVDPKHLRNVHGPCPVCGGVDRYRFDDKDGRGTFYCNSCGAGSGFDLLILVHGWTFVEACKQVERVLGKAPDPPPFKSKPDPARALNAVYKGSAPITEGDASSLYLRARGLTALPPALRTHPGLSIYGQTYSAMLGVVTDVKGKAVSIHRTYLQGTSKAPIDTPKRLMPGKASVTGAAIRLWPALDTIGLAEGIETACAAAQLWNIPTWACLSAGGLEKVKLPPEITRVLIFGDNDSHKSFTGEAASYALAVRLTKEGRQVEVHIPAISGFDWLEELSLRYPPEAPSRASEEQRRLLL